MGLGVRLACSVWSPGCCDKGPTVPRTPRDKGLSGPNAGPLEVERGVVGFHRVFDWLGIWVVSGVLLLTHGAGMKSFTGLLPHPQTHR